MRRWIRLAPLAMALGCSGLDEGEAGIVSLEVTIPSLSTLEVGEQLQLSAVPLNADGDVVPVAVSWRTPDPTIVAVDAATGLLTGVGPGTGRVQATAGSLSSDLLSFNIILGTDTLVIVGDSIVPVPLEPGTTGALVVQLRSFVPADPVPGGPVIYEITSPAAGVVPVVALTGGVQIDTLTTGADGTVATVMLSRTPGTVAPDTAIVQVRATRSSGAPVPGSGQRFIVLFQ